MTDLELFRLQGFPDKRIALPQGVTKRQLRQMIGNSFTVTVFMRVLSQALKSIGHNTEPFGHSAEDYLPSTIE